MSRSYGTRRDKTDLGDKLRRKLTAHSRVYCDDCGREFKGQAAWYAHLDSDRYCPTLAGAVKLTLDLGRYHPIGGQA